MNHLMGGTGTTMPSVRSSRHSSGSVCISRRCSALLMLIGIGNAPRTFFPRSMKRTHLKELPFDSAS